MQPEMSLVYSSSGGSSLLGVGWQLGGLGQINLCSRNVAQDGGIATSMDRYCLNGQRLRKTAGTNYGDTGSTYQTEIDTFVRVLAQSSGTTRYFTAIGKDGRSYEYGATADARLVIGSQAVRWMLNKVSDRNGNSLKITYSIGAGAGLADFVPITLSWGPTSAGASTYNYTATLAYDARTGKDIQHYSLLGSARVGQNRLKSITIKYGVVVQRFYSLTYDLSPVTSQSRLLTIKECADTAMTNCLSPTSLSYVVSSLGVGSTQPNVATNVNTFGGVADFNGDGRKDAYFAVGTTTYVSFGTSTGLGAPFNTGVPAGAYAGDIVRSGKDDFLSSNSRYYWNGTSFVSVATNLAFSGNRRALADVNGDGLPDYVADNMSSPSLNPSTRVAWVNLNTSTNGVASFGPQQTVTTWSGNNCVPNAQTCIGLVTGVFDVNNDGARDIGFVRIAQPNYTNNITWYSWNGSGYTAVSSYPSSNTGTPLIEVRWNDDTCADHAGGSTISVSACNGTVGYTVTFTGTYLAGMDWDGDGRKDALVRTAGNTLGYALSTGNGAAATVDTGIPIANTRLIPGDLTGDGLEDLVVVTGSAAPYSVAYMKHNPTASGLPDQVSTITDGLGNSQSLLYSTLADTTVYTKGTGAGAPEKDTADPYDVGDESGRKYGVVKSATRSDGKGGTFTQTYKYVGARVDTTGRGFEGFQSVTVSDSRALEPVRKVTYNTLFPYTGTVLETNTYQSNGSTLIERTANTWNKKSLDTTAGNQRYWPFISGSTTTSYEVNPGGTKDGVLITTRSISSVTYDNYGNLLGSTETLTDSDLTSPFTGQQLTTVLANTMQPADTANWCLGLPQESTITKSGITPTIAAKTRTVSFTPDASPTLCRVASRTIEPSATTTYKVVETFAFDAFGNVSSDTVAPTNLSSRVTTVDWGATGQFPEKVTDPVGNALGASGYKEIRTYNYGLGVQLSSIVKNSSETVTNAPATSWLYDAFARQTRVTRPDGTYTTTDYSACASANNYCGTGSASTNVRIESYLKSYSSSSVLITQQYMAVDGFGRTRFQKSVDIAGNWVTVQTQYDTRGNVYQQSMPYTSTAYFKTYSYDALNRATQEARPKKASDLTAQYTKLEYLGREVDITDALNNETKQVSRVNGQPGRSVDAGGYAVTFGYDAFGSLTSVVDSLSKTLFGATYDYGADAYQRTALDIDRGSRTINVNALGEVTSYQDANGSTAGTSVTFGTYDRLGRPSNRTEPATANAPALVTTWTWGNNPSAHNVGQLQAITSVADGTLTYTEGYTFDSKGRLTSQSISPGLMGAQVFDIAYESTTGLVDTLTYPTSTSNYRLKLQYSYANGILSSVKDFNAPTTVFWAGSAMSPWGALTQETLGNGVITTRSFDAVTGWLATNQAGVSGGTGLLNQSYFYDLLGNVSQRQNNNLGLTENACYDALSRLTKTTASGGCSGTATLSVAYDSMGNITSRSDVGAGAAWTYDATRKHQVLTSGAGTSYVYDANGNITSRNGSSITWTSYDMPQTINGSGENTTFDYGPTHQYWRQTYSGPSGNETTYYLNKLVEKVDTAAGSDWRHYIVGPSGVVAIYSRQSSGTNTVRYRLSDHQGSVASLLTSAGATHVNESFAPFGAQRDPATWSGAPTTGDQTLFNGVSRVGYTGHAMLGNLGLIHMNGRVQDSRLGRFLSADPYVTDPSDTQSFNRYSYVLNNPLTYVDPSGFTECGAVYSGQTCDLNPNGTCDSGSTLVQAPNGDFHCVKDVTVTPPRGDGPSSPGGVFPGTGRGQNDEPGSHTGGGATQGHEYRAWNEMCNRPLTPQEKKELISRFTVPNSYTLGQPKTAGTYLVAHRGIPGGIVTTTFSPDGAAGKNETSPFHIFTGTVERTIVNTDSGAYMQTHGYGGYGSMNLPPQQPNVSMAIAGLGIVITTDYGSALDSVNNSVGPDVFNNVDKQAALYAKSHFPGCQQ
jgi:RHS repeat-associated protein